MTWNRFSGTDIFLWILRIFKTNYFQEHLWTVASNFKTKFIQNTLHNIQFHQDAFMFDSYITLSGCDGYLSNLK